jgi:hypothetical protein
MPAVLRAEAGTTYLPGLRHDDDYRSNVAVTAGETAGVTATFALYRGGSGLVASGVERWVGAGQQDQWAVDKLFPGMTRDGVPMTVRVALSAPGVAYASLVDNRSTDAVTYLGKEPAYDWIVPAVAHNPGRDGTFWSSNVAISNLNPNGTMVELEYLPEKTDNSGGGELHYVAFQPWASGELQDVVLSTFGIGNGKGVLVVRASQPVVVTSRVFTAGPNGGTTGHGLQTVPLDSLGMEQRVLPGVRMVGGFRTNVGVVSGGVWTSIRLRLRDQDGVQIGEQWLDVPARSLRQWSLDTIFGGQLPDPAGSLVVDGSSEFLAYMVVIDGSSQDPIMFVP